MNDKIEEMNATPGPGGELALQTVTMPRDTNANGDIFGGWLLSQMDLAGGIKAAKVAQGRIATVAIDQMSFLVPVEVGTVISCYVQTLAIGQSSMQIRIEVWKHSLSGMLKVTDGIFVYVAIDEKGRTRQLPANLAGSASKES